jgi:internalin A
MTNKELLQIIKKAARDKATTLDLSGQGLTTLPAEIGQLTNLSVLDLGGNQLTTLPAVIGQLTNLSQLYLRNNQLTTLPAVIGQLTNLSVLDLGGNQLTTLPAVIGQLTNLSVLDLSDNQLTTLPAVIGQLTNLSVLDLSDNQLTTLPAVIGQLTNLSQLYLENNQLTTLPQQIQRLTKLEKLDLRGESNGKLQIPPEILGSSWNDLGKPSNILNYYFSLQTEKKKPLNEAKVLLVGQGSVGKTSLVKRLLEDCYDSQERKTEGINIRNWEISINGQSIRLNMWDFGGQEIMHATHQFFLTKRSLYLLVIDARIDERHNELEYWLQIIESFGGDSPIIIVGNKIDQHPLDLGQGELKKKYPAIKDIVPVSCQTGEGLERLQSVITKQIAGLEHIYDVLPESWFKVKTRLEQIEKDYIPYSEYESLCQEENIGNATSQTTLIELLHRLGIILNFCDDRHLGEMGVLNPEWVTNGVYKILNDNRLMTQCQGIMDDTELKRILNDPRYPQNKQSFIVEMMQKFELCFPLEDRRFLIPDLLPKEERATGDWEDILAFQYHYNVLPSSIISRFIVRMHHHSDQKTWWRSGIVLKNQGNRALIKSDREDRKIFISISGSLSTRRELLAMIRSQFDAIHQTIKGLVAKEKVAIPGYPNHVVDYQTLVEYERQGLRIIPDGLQESFDPRQLLDGIEPAADRRKSSTTTINTPHNPPMADKPQPEDPKPSPHASPAERGIALAMALVVLVVFIVLVLNPQAMQSSTLAIVRFLAAAFAGIAGYLVTGNLGLEAHVPFNKTSIKATGAFAAFVMVLLLFFYGVPASESSNNPKPTSDAKTTIQATPHYTP